MKHKLLSLLLLLILLCSLTLTAYAAPPRVNDYAGLLNAGDAAALEEEFAYYKESFDLDVVVVTVDSLDGKTAQAYADDYYDYGGYGENGVLLLVSMGEREWHISTSGTAIGLIDDSDLVYLEDRIVPHLSDGDYYEAFYQFQYSLLGCVTPESPLDNLIISLPAGLIVALIVILIMRATMNTKTAQRTADAYQTRDSFHLRTHQDLFLYSNVTKQPIPQQTSSGSGGSSVHRSSSGSSHGGRGGKF